MLVDRAFALERLRELIDGQRQSGHALAHFGIVGQRIGLIRPRFGITRENQRVVGTSGATGSP